jgi:hypothetical protein
LPQDNLSQQERLCLEEAWQMENLGIAKCRAYTEDCSDQRISSMLADISRTKQRHAEMLKRLLG